MAAYEPSMVDFPRISQQSWIVVDAVLLTSAATAAAVRIGLRIYYFGRLQLDDYLMLISLSALITSFGLAFYCRQYIYDQVAMALGIYPIPEDVDDRLSHFLKFLAALNVMQWIAIFLVKISYLIFFYKLVEGVKKMMIVWKVTAAFVIVSGIVCMFLPLSTCPNFYESHILDVCSFESMFSHEYAWGIVSAVLDIVTDIAVISIPIAVLRRVNLTFSHKLALGSVLCLSIVMVIIALIRIGAAFLPNNVTDTVWLTFWQCVEASVAILMVSATGFRSLFGQRNSASRIARSPSPQDGLDGKGADLEANKLGITVDTDMEMSDRKHFPEDGMRICRLSSRTPPPRRALDLTGSESDLDSQLQMHSHTLRAYSSKCALIRANSSRCSTRSLRSQLSPLSTKSMHFPPSRSASPNTSVADFSRGAMSPTSIGSPVRCRTPELWRAVEREEWDLPEGPLPMPPHPPSRSESPSVAFEHIQEARLQHLQKIRIHKPHHVKLLSTSALPPSPFKPHRPVSPETPPPVPTARALAERYSAAPRLQAGSLTYPHNHSNKTIHTQTQRPIVHELPAHPTSQSHIDIHTYRDRYVEITSRPRTSTPDRGRPRDKEIEILAPKPISPRALSPPVPLRHPARVYSLLATPDIMIPAPVGPLPPLPERRSEESEENGKKGKDRGKAKADADATDEGEDVPWNASKIHGMPRVGSWRKGDDIGLHVSEDVSEEEKFDSDSEYSIEEVEEIIRLPSPPLPPIPLPLRDPSRESFMVDGRYISRSERESESSSIRGSASLKSVSSTTSSVLGTVETEVFEKRIVSMPPKGEFQGGGAKELFKGPETHKGDGRKSWPG